MPHPPPRTAPGHEPVHRVTEEIRGGRIPLCVHPEWARGLPWVVQGTTVRTRAEIRQPAHDRAGRTRAEVGRTAPYRAGRTRADERPPPRARERPAARADSGEGEDVDFGLFTGAPAGAVMKRWELLAEDTGCESLVHARQVHGRAITLHEATPRGLLLAPPCDGHATRRPGTLLAVSVADCVPVFVVAPGARAVMLLHAGWRGVASGILEAGLAMLERDFGTHVRETRMHMGPAICGDCYEVGREVHEALGLPRPASPREPVDLRRALLHRALAAGADPAHLTTSTFCTRCADAPFFSHRGGDAGRQLAVLGIVPNDAVPPRGEGSPGHRREPS